MSRLDSAIRRLQAQKILIEAALDLVKNDPSLWQQGVFFELGLGNGRTYDHIRQWISEDQIYVFERKVQAHPDCIPPASNLFLGDVSDTLIEAGEKLTAKAVFCHIDIGSGDAESNRMIAEQISQHLPKLLKDRAIVLYDQQLVLDQLQPLALPDGVAEGRYGFTRYIA